MLAKVTSLFDLFHKAETDKRYEQLAIIGAKGLGGNGYVLTFDEAKKWLVTAANADGDCRMVVAEVNLCRNLVREDKPTAKNTSQRLKAIKCRDMVDSDNYIRWTHSDNYIRWTQREPLNTTFTEAAQEFDRISQVAQETNATILVAQQQPSTVFIDEQPDFISIPDGFYLDTQDSAIRST